MLCTSPVQQLCKNCDIQSSKWKEMVEVSKKIMYFFKFIGIGTRGVFSVESVLMHI